MNSSCEDNDMRTERGWGCSNAWQAADTCQTGFNQPWNTQANMMGMGFNPNMPRPLVMPAQVVTRQTFSFVDQPVIVPVECRTINRPICVPRFCPTFTHTFFNC